jgi:hypothetical protein
MIVRVSLIRDTRAEDPQEFWCAVAAEGELPGAASAMFYVYAKDETGAREKLRAIGAALMTATIEPGLLTCRSPADNEEKPF